ncbi:MAG TPA: hypothetical protein VL752_07555 [Acidisoma sp.]|jgi:hypothetical protein|uniref:hypothetical protein n=1 Tax=Acidisoma sp. TaxID=1872115 RepID=UPI002BE88EAB|nr:hypothetical protein [Acidisoma sp.]HTI00786.1 hypothetical protein [Acidisoma sp.]
MDNKEFHSIARIDVRHQLFANIAMRNYVLFKQSSKSLEDLGERREPDEQGYDLNVERKFHDLGEQEIESAFSVILYSAMCFESAIYDHAAQYFGDSYVADHFDKLDLLSKWLVIPQLTWKRELRKGHAPYQHLATLVRARNRLVHHKSENIKMDDNLQMERLRRRSEEFKQDVENAMKALILISLEMDWLSDPPRSINPLPRFGVFVGYPEKRYPSEMAPLVSECKRIFARSIGKGSEEHPVINPLG